MSFRSTPLYAILLATAGVFGAIAATLLFLVETISGHAIEGLMWLGAAMLGILLAVVSVALSGGREAGDDVGRPEE